MEDHKYRVRKRNIVGRSTTSINRVIYWFHISSFSSTDLAYISLTSTQYRSCPIVRPLTTPQWWIRYSQVAAVCHTRTSTKRWSLIVNHVEVSTSRPIMAVSFALPSSEQVDRRLMKCSFISPIDGRVFLREPLRQTPHRPVHARIVSRNRCIFANRELRLDADAPRFNPFGISLSRLFIEGKKNLLISRRFFYIIIDASGCLFLQNFWLNQLRYVKCFLREVISRLGIT